MQYKFVYYIIELFSNQGGKNEIIVFFFSLVAERLERNKSLTKPEIETYWKMHQEKEVEEKEKFKVSLHVFNLHD